MMSMVPEEGSLTPSEIQPTNKSPTPPAEPTPTPRKRAVETLNNIKTIGSISASSDQIHKTSSSIQTSGNYTLPRRIDIKKPPPLPAQPPPNQQYSTFNSKIPVVELSYQVYKSHDSGISSNGFANLSPNKREEGDGEEYSQNYSQNATLRIQDKYSLEPPEVPPRDYTTDEDGPQVDNGKHSLEI